MKYLIFISLFVFCSANANAQSDSEVLTSMLKSHSSSMTFHSWHKTKEELESLGFNLWNRSKTDPEFCQSMQSLPGDLKVTLSDWSTLGPEACQIEAPVTAYSFDFSVFRSQVLLEPCTSQIVNKNDLQNTREVLLDTTGGPRLVTGDLKKCEVAFTFDDGPSPTYTTELLEILDQHNVRANFFTVGRNVARYPEVALQTAQTGHILGNHSYSHKNLPKLKHKDAVQEIVGGFEKLLNIFDTTTPFFRFPYGAFTQKTRSYIQKRDIAEFFWNMDTRDWALKNPSELFRNVVKEINREKKGILLFHDVHPQTIEVMPQLLLALKQAGYSTAIFKPKEMIEGN